MNSEKISKIIALFFTLFFQEKIFSSQALVLNLQKVLIDTKEEIQCIDKNRTINPRHSSPLAYENTRNKINDALGSEKIWEVRQDNCCYYMCIPVVAIVSALTLDSEKYLSNSFSRQFCIRSMNHGTNFLEKKNQ